MCVCVCVMQSCFTFAGLPFKSCRLQRGGASKTGERPYGPKWNSHRFTGSFWRCADETETISAEIFPAWDLWLFKRHREALVVFVSSVGEIDSPRVVQIYFLFFSYTVKMCGLFCGRFICFIFSGSLKWRCFFLQRRYWLLKMRHR